ncbi:MAG TPA: hypothetical protein DHW02_17015, partial [Ktedonobacter sp.]|nr:hypothetical protein [Ktedonobacter sp.]
QHGPIFRTTRFGDEITYLVGPEANRFVLVSNRQKFSHHEGWGRLFNVIDMFGDGLLTMDGKEHDQHRRMMNPAFAVGYMSHYIPLMNRIIRERTAKWVAQDTVDIYDEARKITFDVAAEALAGLTDQEERDHFRKLYYSLLNGPGNINTEEEYYRWLRGIQPEVMNLLLPKIEERRKHPTDDLFSMLVHAHDDQGQTMSVEQLIAHFNILMVAGHETSTSLSSWLLYLLTQHPDYTKRILDEQKALLHENEEPTLETIKQMKVLENALSEAERMYPPVANGPRGVVEDFEFNGYHVPAGSYVLYSIAASHLLPSVFANPTTFDPDRFAPPREEHKKTPYSLVGFGGGPRICIGINFAQIEIKALATHVLRHYRLEVLPNQHIAQYYDATGGPMHGIKMHVSEKQQKV